MSRTGAFAIALAMVLAPGVNASAADIAKLNAWSALASDPAASRVGDGLTVLIQESAYASNSAQASSRKTMRLEADASSGANASQGVRAGLSSRYDGAGQGGRADRMVAQISVVVVDVLPSGDLQVAGEQRLLVNGEETLIGVRGRVRRADISGVNTVLSTRLADAEITYDGRGFSGRAAKPGLIPRLLNGVGIF